MVFNERFLTPMGLRDSKKRSKFVSRWKNRHFVSSFKYAVEGLVTAYREERNLLSDFGRNHGVFVPCFGKRVALAFIEHLFCFGKRGLEYGD